MMQNGDEEEQNNSVPSVPYVVKTSTIVREKDFKIKYGEMLKEI